MWASFKYIPCGNSLHLLLTHGLKAFLCVGMPKHFTSWYYVFIQYFKHVKKNSIQLFIKVDHKYCKLLQVCYCNLWVPCHGNIFHNVCKNDIRSKNQKVYTHILCSRCSQTLIFEQSHEKFTSQFEIQNETDIFSFLFKDLNCSKEKCNPLI